MVRGKRLPFILIVGLVKPTSGSIFIDNKNITSYAMYRRAQNGIGYLAQEASIFRKLSVEDNIMGLLQLNNLSRKQQKMKCDELIEEFLYNMFAKTEVTYYQEENGAVAKLPVASPQTQNLSS